MEHRYASTVRWTGSTGLGYADYDRTHEAHPGTGPGWRLSADPHFLGDPGLPNPEELLLMAASSCQLLSFLAVAARARLDVTAYRDQAEAIMPAESAPVAVREIVLRPVITLAPGSPLERVERLAHIAHRECFIANSLTAAMTIEGRAGDGQREVEFEVRDAAS